MFTNASTHVLVDKRPTFWPRRLNVAFQPQKERAFRQQSPGRHRRALELSCDLRSSPVPRFRPYPCRAISMHGGEGGSRGQTRYRQKESDREKERKRRRQIKSESVPVCATEREREREREKQTERERKKSTLKILHKSSCKITSKREHTHTTSRWQRERYVCAAAIPELISKGQLVIAHLPIDLRRRPRLYFSGSSHWQA